MKLIETIRQAGIVGCGGAGFPTHVKLNGEAEFFIVNAAECEPLLRTDRYLLRHRAEAIVQGAIQCGKAVGAKRVVLALKETYEEEIEAVRGAIHEGDGAELFLLKNFYPAGDEQVLVYEVTGRVIPPAGLPGNVGAIVCNAATMNAVWDALSQGIPLTEKYITITGAVERPLIVKAPLGTSIRECVEASGPIPLRWGFVMGGPLMGKTFQEGQQDVQTVTKTTSGIIVLEEDAPLLQKGRMPLRHMLNRAKSACIQCSYCTELCPRHLLGHPLRPNRIMRSISWCENLEDLLETEEIRQALICSECGICEEYACPMGLQPRKVNQMLKKILTEEKVKYQRGEGPFVADEMREYRRVPSKRLAARLSVDQYYDLRIDQLAIVEPQKIRPLLKQHIGAPSIPCVKPGDRVKAGQLIAHCPEGALGADLHAPISGIVREIGEAIAIEGC